jgi:hypothetical protein
MGDNNTPTIILPALPTLPSNALQYANGYLTLLRQSSSVVVKWIFTITLQNDDDHHIASMKEPRYRCSLSRPVE